VALRPPAPAVPGLHTQRHVQVRPDGKVWPQHADRLFAQPLGWTYRPGAVIADGSAQKRVYAVAGRPHLVIRQMKEAAAAFAPRGQGQDAWARSWILIQEYHDLNLLQAHGFPVPKVFATGKLHNVPADVMERFEMSDRDAVTRRGEAARNARQGDRLKWMQPGVVERLLTPASRPYLLQIRRAIQAGTAIRDLQLLLKPGRVVVFDPAGIVLRSEQPKLYQRHAAWNLQKIDRMLGMIP